MMVKKADTPIGRKIWAEVAKAAEGCPEWMKAHVKRVAEASARRAMNKDK